MPEGSPHGPQHVLLQAALDAEDQVAAIGPRHEHRPEFRRHRRQRPVQWVARIVVLRPAIARALARQVVQGGLGQADAQDGGRTHLGGLAVDDHQGGCIGRALKGALQDAG